MANVEVRDVDGAVSRAKALGAKVLAAPSDIPNVGRFSGVIADPQGASFALHKPASQMKLHDTSQPGEFCWGELIAADHEAAFRFYAEVLSWEKVSEFDMGQPMGKYLLFGKGETQYGGMFTKTREMPLLPVWVYYVHVDSLDEAMSRARAKGGKLMKGPHTVPTGARIAQMLDPQGASFALHEDAKTKR